MKIHRKRPFILGIFLLISTISLPIYGQATYVVNQSNLQAFLQHLECEYGDEIHVNQSQIRQFFKNLPNFNNSNDQSCSPPEAAIVNSVPGKMGFDWRDVPEAKDGYYSASFSLDDGRTQRKRTRESEVAFSSLNEHLYLFAFISNCRSKFSSAFIIIAEKDLFLTGLEHPSFDLSCRCDGNPTQLPYADDCVIIFYETYAFNYSNTCPANKYVVSVNGTISSDGEPDQAYFSQTIFINDETPQPDEIFVMQYCTDGGSSPNDFVFGDLNHYQVFFTANKFLVHILNNDLDINYVTAYRCGCYFPSGRDGDPFNGGGGSDNRSIAGEEGNNRAVQVAPNPFQDQLLINWNSSSEEKVSITLYDISGKVVAQVKESQFLAGEHQVQLMTASLPAGLYHLNVASANEIFQQKVLKIH